MSAQQMNLKNTSLENQKLALCHLNPSNTGLNLAKPKKLNKLSRYLGAAKIIFQKMNTVISKEWERGEKMDKAIREARANQTSRFDYHNRHNW